MAGLGASGFSGTGISCMTRWIIRVGVEAFGYRLVRRT